MCDPATLTALTGLCSRPHELFPERFVTPDRSSTPRKQRLPSVPAPVTSALLPVPVIRPSRSCHSSGLPGRLPRARGPSTARHAGGASAGAGVGAPCLAWRSGSPSCAQMERALLIHVDGHLTPSHRRAAAQCRSKRHAAVGVVLRSPQGASRGCAPLSVGPNSLSLRQCGIQPAPRIE